MNASIDSERFRLIVRRVLANLSSGEDVFTIETIVDSLGTASTSERRIIGAQLRKHQQLGWFTPSSVEELNGQILAVYEPALSGPDAKQATAELWSDSCSLVIRQFVANGKPFTIEDVLGCLTSATGSERQRLKSAIKKAVNAGLCEPVRKARSRVAPSDYVTVYRPL